VPGLPRSFRIAASAAANSSTTIAHDLAESPVSPSSRQIVNLRADPIARVSNWVGSEASGMVVRPE